MGKNLLHQTFSPARLAYTQALLAGKLGQIDGVDDDAVMLAVQMFDLGLADNGFQERMKRLLLITEMRPQMDAKLAMQCSGALVLVIAGVSILAVGFTGSPIQAFIALGFMAAISGPTPMILMTRLRL